MKTQDKIRNIVNGRMQVEISRECKYAPGQKFVRLFYGGKIGKAVSPTMSAVGADLKAAGFSPERGRYINEISFFVPAKC